MASQIAPRQNDDLKLQYALRDSSGAFVSLAGATVVGYLLRPTSGITTADNVTIIGSPTTYNVEVVFSKAKMTDEGKHKAQIKITFADTTVRHSEIDEFHVPGNIA